MGRRLKTSLKRGSAQPDWVVAIVCLASLLVRQHWGEPLPFSPWWAVLVLGLQLAWVFGREWRFAGQELPERDRASWLAGLAIWCWAASLTGGPMGPVPYVAAPALLHYPWLSRRRRGTSFLLLLAVPWAIQRWVAAPWLSGAMPWAALDLLGAQGYLLGVPPVVVACVLVFAERSPKPLDLFRIDPAKAPDLASFYEQLLAKALRVYHADSGLVAEVRPGPTADSPRLKVKCRGDAHGTRFSEEPGALGDDHVACEAARRCGWATRNTLSGRLEGGRRVRSEAALALTRFRPVGEEGDGGEEAVLVVSVSNRRLMAYLKPDTYDARIFRNSAEMLYEELYDIHAYGEFLKAARNTTSLREGLERIAKQLVPPKLRDLKVEVLLTADQGRLPQDDVVIRHSLKEGRQRERSMAVCVSGERFTEADKDRLRRVLEVFAPAALLADVVQKEEAAEAARKTAIGVSNLEPPDLANLRTRMDLEAQQGPDAYKGLGFPLLWANDLMAAWFPMVRRHPPEDRRPGPAPEGVPVYCYQYFNPPLALTGPCAGCPVLVLLKRYVRAGEEERRRILEQTEVLPAHSPAGEKGIFRHFELAASMVASAFPPDEIGFLRETVTDRTLEVEALGVISGAARALERLRAQGGAGSMLRESEAAKAEILACVSEGLGRALQARKVLWARLRPEGGATATRYEWRAEDPFLRRFLIRREWETLRSSASHGGGGILEYLRERPKVYPGRTLMFPAEAIPRLEQHGMAGRHIEMLKSLLNRRFVSDGEALDFLGGEGGKDSLPSEIRQAVISHRELSPGPARQEVPGAALDYLIGLAGQAEREEGASEDQQGSPKGGGPDCPKLFAWEALSKDARCLVAKVRFTPYIMILATGRPQGWERDPRGRMLPRVSERQLIQGVADMVGFFFHALDTADDLSSQVITQGIKDVMHELMNILGGVSGAARSVRSLVTSKVQVLHEALEAAERHGVTPLLAEWHRLLTVGGRVPGPRGAEDQRRLADAYIQAICPAGRPDGPLWPFDRLGQTGIQPQELPGLEKLGGLPAQDRQAVLRLLAGAADIAHFLTRLAEAAPRADAKFRRMLADFEAANVNVPVLVRQIAEELAGELPPPLPELALDVPEEMDLPISRDIARTCITNLVRNALEAVAHSGQGGPVRLSAGLQGTKLVVRVINGPPLVGRDLVPMLFQEGVSTKPGGTGKGLYLARAAARRAGGDVTYASRESRNVFTLRLPLQASIDNLGTHAEGRTRHQGSGGPEPS